jgi:hypothetical protein
LILFPFNFFSSGNSFGFVWCFWDRVSIGSPGWPWTQDPPVSTSQELEKQACTTISCRKDYLVVKIKNDSKDKQGCLCAVFLQISLSWMVYWLSLAPTSLIIHDSVIHLSDPHLYWT